MNSNKKLLNFLIISLLFCQALANADFRGG